MALNKIKLKSDIKSLLQDMQKFDDKDQSIETYSDRLSTIIDDYIKSAQVDPGIAVSVVGSATAQTGSTTAPGTLS